LAIYLVDYENRSGKSTANGLNGIERLTNNDSVTVFLGKSNVVPAEILDRCVNRSKARVTFHKCRKSARNYLDFQLVTHLGFLAATREEREYHIVSDDKGYYAAVDYWLAEHPDYTIIRQPFILAPEPEPPAKKPKASKPKGKKAKKGEGTAGPDTRAEAAAPAEDMQSTGGANGLPEPDPLPVPTPPDQKINKLDPPESIRKVARTIYKQEGIKLGYISQLYDEMRASAHAKSFSSRIASLYEPDRLARLRPDLLALFDRYASMR
jgi:hypothetical protein